LRWVRHECVRVADLTLEVLDAAIAVLQKYADLPADFADASLVAIADRLGIRQVASFDRDFLVHRYRKRFRFVPLLMDDN